MRRNTPGKLDELDVPVRQLIARTTKSKKALAVVAAGVALAVAGTTAGYATLSKSVTLSVDGEPREVSAFGATTVSEVLESEGLEVDERDVVAPGLDEEVSDGSRVAVRFARPLELTVDGETQEHWVTATSVGAALDQVGNRFEQADLSVSRGAEIDRGGLDVEVVTPKKFRVKDGAKKPVTKKLTALTTRDVLQELDIELGKHDKVAPKPKKQLSDGGKVTVTRINVANKQVEGETIDNDMVERTDDSMYEDEEEVVREGRDGLRNATYRVRTVNGEVVNRTLVDTEVTRKPVDRVVKVGTKERPEPEPESDPAPAANYASGNSVWDRLAQCESGGNWAINTGNGYYGGLQFTASTWRSVGGSGLPHQHSREEQIKRGKILQSQAGWGQWPACSSKLGLR